MKTRTVKALFVLLLSFALALSLGGCAASREQSFFEPFRAPFTAQIEGTVRGEPFSALLTAGAPNTEGARALTLTFYAPEALRDTALALHENGTLSLCAGGITLQSDAAKGLLPLLTLFPTTGEVQKASMTEAGHTLVVGEGFSLEFLPDGTPYRASNACAEVTVITFTRE